MSAPIPTTAASPFGSPNRSNVRVSARTSNSSISSEFDAVMHGDLRRNEFEGSIGKGGPLLDLSSSNGAIRIVRN